MAGNNENLEILNWGQDGYQPLVFSHDWQVALLNWERNSDLEKVNEVERHNQSDEVFVLWRGRGVLLVFTPKGLRVEDMRPGELYNVRAGTWHNVVASRDASWIIVEDRDTHLHDCEIRPLTPKESHQLYEKVPAWVKK
jgi:mannose-6-phosphate isomerase-like protein (cupin superfamily)